MKRLASLALLALLGSCGGDSAPDRVISGEDMCAFCRMPVSDPRFAAQITAPGELALFFDDPGCLGEFVRSGGAKDPRALAYVADHRSHAWVRADLAIYTRVPGLATPMSHHLVAHESVASRDSDPEARSGEPVSRAEIFGPKGPPKGAAP